MLEDFFSSSSFSSSFFTHSPLWIFTVNIHLSSFTTLKQPFTLKAIRNKTQEAPAFQSSILYLCNVQRVLH